MVGEAVKITGGAVGGLSGVDCVGGSDTQFPGATPKLGAGSQEKNGSVQCSGIIVLILRCLGLCSAILWAISPSALLDVLLFIASTLSATWGLAALMRPEAPPRGCECIPACTAAEQGLFSCPVVPWTLGLWGALNMLLTVLLIIPQGVSEVSLEGISATAVSTFGFFWLARFRLQAGYICCAPAFKTVAEETIGASAASANKESPAAATPATSLPSAAPVSVSSDTQNNQLSQEEEEASVRKSQSSQGEVVGVG